MVFQVNDGKLNVKMPGTVDNLKDTFAALQQYNFYQKESATNSAEWQEILEGMSPSFQKYIASLNGAKAGHGGYAASLVGTTLKTIAMTAAQTALNAAMTMGISIIIQAAISAFTALADAISTTDDRLREYESAQEKLDKSNEKIQTYKDEISAIEKQIKQKKENLIIKFLNNFQALGLVHTRFYFIAIKQF